MGSSIDNIGVLLAVSDWLSRSSNNAPKAEVFTGIPSGRGSASQAPPQPTMATLLNAVIKVYEIQGGLQQLNSFNIVGLDYTILVKVASTALVSWLVDLSEAQTLARALSNLSRRSHFAKISPSAQRGTTKRLGRW